MTEDKPFQLEQVSVRIIRDAPMYSDIPINSPAAAVKVLNDAISDYDREVVAVVNLNNKNVPINMNIVGIGTINATLVSPREMLKTAFLSNAAGILLIHNHPSGDVTPSTQDINMTQKMEYICELADIDFKDHIIIGTGEKFFSLKEKKEHLISSYESYKNEKKCNKTVAEKETGKKSISEDIKDKKEKVSREKKTVKSKNKEKTRKEER